MTYEIDGTEYIIPFVYGSPEHIKCFWTESEGRTPLEFGVGYTVSPPKDKGGSLTLLQSLPEEAEKILIMRETPQTQPADLENGQKLYAELIEGMADRSVMLIQETGGRIDDMPGREDLLELEDAISTETGDRIQAVENLAGEIENGIDNHNEDTEAHPDIRGDLSDTAYKLQNAVDGEKNDRMEADQNLALGVTNSISAHDISVVSHQDIRAAIEKLEPAGLDELVQSVEGLQGSLQTESQARQNGDNNLSQSISNESQARQNWDNNLSQAIGNETQARQQAVSGLDGRVTELELGGGGSGGGPDLMPKLPIEIHLADIYYQETEIGSVTSLSLSPVLRVDTEGVTGVLPTIVMGSATPTYINEFVGDISFRNLNNDVVYSLNLEFVLNTSTGKSMLVTALFHAHPGGSNSYLNRGIASDEYADKRGSLIGGYTIANIFTND